jgi:hypothetical protein
MLRRTLILAAAVAMLPLPAPAQTVGIGMRAGTFGLGGELSVRLTDNLAVRGGVGVLPVEWTGDLGDISYTVKPTSPLGNVGIDFFPGGAGLRLGAGLLFISETTDLTGEYSGTVRIGDRTYTGAEVGSLTGLLDHGSMAPYVNIGFGRGAARGLGLFLDLGAAFMAEPSLTLRATGPATQSAEFQQNLEKERQKAEEDARRYLRIFPMVSIGLRFGIM